MLERPAKYFPIIIFRRGLVLCLSTLATFIGIVLTSTEPKARWRKPFSLELGQLKSRILRATGIDEMLHTWSEGIVSNKTFKQITEEFAEIIIPKIWLREDRKICRVATQLSMSPKKVRRILNKVNTVKLSR